MRATTGTVQVSHYDSNGTWLIALAGEHDIATSPLVDARTLGLWPRCSVAVVDLRYATFIDSTVVNWLMRVRRTLEDQGSSDGVRIVEDPQSNALHPVFDALGLREEFAFYTTVRGAATAQARRVVPGEVRLHRGDREIFSSGGQDAPGETRLT